MGWMLRYKSYTSIVTLIKKKKQQSRNNVAFPRPEIGRLYCKQQTQNLWFCLVFKYRWYVFRTRLLCGCILLTSKMELTSRPHSSQVHSVITQGMGTFLIPPPGEKFCTSSAQSGYSYLFPPQLAQGPGNKGKLFW